jgi:phosphonoacetaldehyde hydrolase
MCLENARRLRVWPLSSIVKVDDTLPGVEEGLNAGMWTVALARTGNEMGLTLAEVEALEPADHDRRLSKARERLARAGAHYVVDDILGVPACLDDIERRLARGEQP